MPVPVALNRAAYGVVPLVGIALAAVVAHETLLRGNGAEELRRQQSLCFAPGRARLDSDLTRGVVPVLDNTVCVVHPFVRQAVSSETTLGFQALLFSMAIPILYRLNHLSISPNFSPVFFSGLTTLVAVVLSLVLGPGVVGAGFVVPVYALGMLAQLSNKIATTAPVPVVAQGAYTNNISVMSLTSLLALSYLLDSSKPGGRSNWMMISMLICLWPAYQAIMLPLAALGKGAPSSEADARKQLRSIDGDSLSYGFERIWGYYRRLALVSIGLYYFGMMRVGRLFFDTFTDASLLDTLLGRKQTSLNALERGHTLNAIALAYTLVSLLFIERMTIRTVQPPRRVTSQSAAQTVDAARKPHPLTGSPRHQLDIDCQRAIMAAPAGMPAAESGWGTILCMLIGGPGFASLLWWSRGEEEMGWKARKAWRTAVATEGKIESK